MTEVANQPTQEAQLAPLVWQVARENFAVISGSAIVTGLALAIIFLFSYLSMFDWHLIAFVQYVDVISFGIIAVGLVGGSFAVLNAIQYFLYLPKETKEYRRLRWIVDGGVALAVVGF